MPSKSIPILKMSPIAFANWKRSLANVRVRGWHPLLNSGLVVNLTQIIQDSKQRDQNFARDAPEDESERCCNYAEQCREDPKRPQNLVTGCRDNSRRALKQPKTENDQRAQVK